MPMGIRGSETLVWRAGQQKPSRELKNREEHPELQIFRPSKQTSTYPKVNIKHLESFFTGQIVENQNSVQKVNFERSQMQKVRTVCKSWYDHETSKGHPKAVVKKHSFGGQAGSEPN